MRFSFATSTTEYKFGEYDAYNQCDNAPREIHDRMCEGIRLSFKRTGWRTHRTRGEVHFLHSFETHQWLVVSSIYVVVDVHEPFRQLCAVVEYERLRSIRTCINKFFKVFPTNRAWKRMGKAGKKIIHLFAILERRQVRICERAGVQKPPCLWPPNIYCQ